MRSAPMTIRRVPIHRRTGSAPKTPRGKGAGKPGCRLGIPQTRTRSSQAEGSGMRNPPHPGHRDHPPAEGRPMSITRNAYPARLRVIIVAAVLPIAGLLFAAGQAGSAHAAAARTTHASTATWAGGPEPTIVLVHGAWADASSWDGVIARLQADGFAAIAAPNPLRGLAVDSSYLADFLSSIQGPIVLVGHSYGGSGINHCRPGQPKLQALL